MFAVLEMFVDTRYICEITHIPDKKLRNTNIFDALLLLPRIMTKSRLIIKIAATNIKNA